MNHVSITSEDQIIHNKSWAASFSTTSAPVTRPGDYVVLHFSDGKQIFAQCLPGRQGGVKIQKRTYDTDSLIGLPYGTVLELRRSKGLLPLALAQHHLLEDDDDDDDSDDDNGQPFDGNQTLECDEDMNHQTPTESNHPRSFDVPLDNCDSFYIDTASGVQPNTPALESNAMSQPTDNRNLMDLSTSQKLNYQDLERMRRDSQVTGRDIVHALIQNSTTYAEKTNFSKAKYVKKKLLKYQPQCRIVPCSAANICHALYLKDARKVSNLRSDTLAQILAYANIYAGSKVMIFDTPGTMGVVTGAVAQRLSGYGLILAIYDKQQPSCGEILDRFNLSFAEQGTIHWLHTSQVFGDYTQDVDYERIEREKLTWPVPLQDHTRKYLKEMMSDADRNAFLDKRCSRFARKLTRPSIIEVGNMARDPNHPCDSLIISCTYDPTCTLLQLLPFLKNGCPFVVYYEFLEPLLVCFQKVQEQGLAIQLRLCDTWMREYQMLLGRTHPNMHMSQNGGFLFIGMKIDASRTVSRENIKLNEGPGSPRIVNEGDEVKDDMQSRKRKKVP